MIQSRTDNLKRSDSHHQQAVLLVTQLSLGADREFTLQHIGDQEAQAVVCGMVAAGLEMPSERMPVEIETSRNLIVSGDLSGFNRLHRERNSLINQAVLSISKTQEKIRVLNEGVQALELRERRVRFVSIGFNVLGLIVVMMKDLPIWKVT